MRPLASIYNHRVSEFMETQVGFNPIQKRNLNPKRKVQTRLSVDRLVDRPMPRSIGPVDRAQLRARPLQSVDRPRSTASSCARLCTPIDRAVDRPPPPFNRAVDREIDREHFWPAQCAVSCFLCLPISVLPPSISSISSLPLFSTAVKIFQI